MKISKEDLGKIGMCTYSDPSIVCVDDMGKVEYKSENGGVVATAVLSHTVVRGDQAMTGVIGASCISDGRLTTPTTWVNGGLVSSSIATPKTYVLDMSKVTTLEDVIAVLGAMNIRYTVYSNGVAEPGYHLLKDYLKEE